MTRLDLAKVRARSAGPIERFAFAFFGLFAPGMLMVAVVKGFARALKDLDDDELLSLIAEIQND